MLPFIDIFRTVPEVLLERPELRECLLADVAGEGPLAPVAPQVRVVRVLVQERLAALLALPRLHAWNGMDWTGVMCDFSHFLTKF